MSVFTRPLPEALGVLRELATDLHWSWSHDSDQLWRLINKEVWNHTQNPVTVLDLTSDQRLEELAQDSGFIERLEQLTQARERYLTEPSWYQNNFSGQDLPGVAYLSMEYGLCDALPLYAGGLGMLAGDYLKTASDLGVPLVAVGLLYQQGYFHQSLDAEGRQQETYLYNAPGSLPLKALRAEDGSWLTIDTGFWCRRVRFRVWQAQVGRVTLYLLDSNDPRNQASDRGITGSLYGGSAETRLVQEIALGICGWRLIETLGLGHYVCHLNEGHAAFATLERIRSYRETHNVSFEQALWATRGGNVFTTHTPVAAGFDRFPPELMRRYITEFTQHLGLPLDELLPLGLDEPDNREELFNMAYLAMHTCARSNGVSRLHGQVSQRIFQPLFPRWPQRQVPVGYVTNGVHLPTWDSFEVDNEWERLFGPERWRHNLNEMSPSQVQRLDDKRLWKMAAQSRALLVDYARKRMEQQWRREADPEQCHLYTERPLDPNLLTLGFARRFAEYKRPNLLLWDPERLVALLNHAQHPIQILVAGKSHPADKWGKQALQAWHDFAEREDVRHRLVLLEDYDIELAQHLVQGVDVWLNNPRVPWEACGTSGMKTLVNGGLNLSTLDGWWAEAYSPELGWALGDGEEHNGDWDQCEAEQLYELLEGEIAPLFYQRDSDDLPRAWLERMRASMANLTTQFSCNRMIDEYLRYYYLPAARSLKARQTNKGAVAGELQNWHKELHRHWHEVHLGQLAINEGEDSWQLDIVVYLGGLPPEAVAVQVIADPTDQLPEVQMTLSLSSTLEGATHAYHFSGSLPKDRPQSDFTARVVGAHPEAQIPAENTLIVWQQR